MSNLSWSDLQQINRITAAGRRAESAVPSTRGMAWWIMAADINALANAAAATSPVEIAYDEPFEAIESMELSCN